MHNTSKLFASLAALGIDPKMETFAERKRVQKTVYLLDKVFGFDFGYYYNWYLHGPYSPQVTQIIFDVVEGRASIDPQPANSNLSPEDCQKIERMRTFLNEDLNSNDKLELLVSVDYLLNYTENATPNEQEIVEFLNIKKPYFSNEEIIQGIKRMQSLRRK